MCNFRPLSIVRITLLLHLSCHTCSLVSFLIVVTFIVLDLGQRLWWWLMTHRSKATRNDFVVSNRCCDFFYIPDRSDAASENSCLADRQKVCMQTATFSIIKPIYCTWREESLLLLLLALYILYVLSRSLHCCRILYTILNYVIIVWNKLAGCSHLDVHLQLNLIFVQTTKNLHKQSSCSF